MLPAQDGKFYVYAHLTAADKGKYATEVAMTS